jgi:hypothetical protein
VDIVSFFLDNAVIPSYYLIDDIIIISKDIYKSLPLSVSLLDTILIYFVERGYDLDDIQLNSVSRYSTSTVLNIRKIYETPYWKRTCKVLKSLPDNKLKTFARDLNIYPK